MFTTIAEFIIDAAFFTAGAAFVWFFKTKLQALVIGANALSAKLHAEANAIAPTVTAAVDAIKKV